MIKIYTSGNAIMKPIIIYSKCMLDKIFNKNLLNSLFYAGQIVNLCWILPLEKQFAAFFPPFWFHQLLGVRESSASLGLCYPFLEGI